MKRSQRFSDWATPEQSGQRAFVERMEVALLRDIAGIDAESMEDVFCWKYHWNEYTNQLLSDSWDEHRYEADWYHSRLTKTAPPALTLPESNGHALSHAVFWSTDFGRVPLGAPDQVAVSERVLPLLAATSSDNREMIGQYLLTLQCAGVELPEQMLAEHLSWYDNSDWPEWGGWKYHPYIVVAILCALRGD